MGTTNKGDEMSTLAIPYMSTESVKLMFALRDGMISAGYRAHVTVWSGEVEIVSSAPQHVLCVAARAAAHSFATA